MKRIILIIAFLLALADPSQAAICYCDYNTGDDTTGSGTYSDPYQTVDGCKVGASLTGAGDEIRVAKTSTTALTGTITFTKESTSATTSSDLTGELSVGDFIAEVQAYNYPIYEISAIDASSVTLTREWATASGAKSMLKINPYNMQTNGHSYENPNLNGTDGNRFKVTGGWDLSTQTRDGYTALESDGALAAFYWSGANDYVELAYFVTLEFDYGLHYPHGSSDGWYVHHCNSGANDWQTYGGLGDYYIGEYLGHSGHNGSSYGTQLQGSFSELNYIYAWSNTNVTIVTGLHQYGNIISNVYSYNADQYVIQLQEGVHISDIYVYDSDSPVFYMQHSPQNTYVNNITVDGALRLVYRIYGGSMYVYNADLSNITGTVCNQSTVYGPSMYEPIAYLRNYGGVTDDDRQCFYQGWVYKDTTDARSGSCIKVGVTVAGYPIAVKLGAVKVSSTASDMDLKIYVKDDASYNGEFYLYAISYGKRVVDPTEKTLTTSYAQYSITVDAADLVTDEYIYLYAMVYGTAGNVFLDDFSAAQ